MNLSITNPPPPPPPPHQNKKWLNQTSFRAYFTCEVEGSIIAAMATYIGIHGHIYIELTCKLCLLSSLLQALVLSRGTQQLVPRRALQTSKPTWHPPWKLMRVISGHLGWVRCIAIDPSNDWFATGSGDRTIKVRRLKKELKALVSTELGCKMTHYIRIFFLLIPYNESTC